MQTKDGNLESLDKVGRYAVALEITHEPSFVSVSCSLCRMTLFYESTPVSGMSLPSIVAACAQTHVHARGIQ